MNLFQLRSVAVAGAAALALILPPAIARAADDFPTTVAASADPANAAEQRAVYAVVHRYEQLLNAGDTSGILDLYAPTSVAEWNDKPTFASRQQKADGYNALFKIAKFTTVFSYDSVDVYADTAVVRTHHHVGATVVENGKKVLDKNREIFVLRKIDGVWKIILYSFNTDPVQGQG